MFVKLLFVIIQLFYLSIAWAVQCELIHIMMNDESVRMRQKMVVICFKILSHCSERLSETTESIHQESWK